MPSRGNHWLNTRRSQAHVATQAADDDSLSWDQLEDLIGWLESRPELTAEQAERLVRLRALRDEGERALEAFYQHVLAENARILAELRAVCALDELSPAKQGSRYAARIGASPLAKVLHLARKGQLSLDRLRRSFKTPKDLLALVAKEGIVRGIVE